MIQLVKCLLHKHEELNLDPQHPWVACTCNPRDGDMEKEGFLEMA